MRNSLSIVVPAYNEAESLRTLLPVWLSFCAERNWQMIIVNDGSRDESSAVLAEYEDQPGLTVLTHKLNRGYGGALKTGLAAAATEFAITIDADGQHRLEDVERMLDALIEQDADLIVGRRDVDASVYRSIGKWGIRRITKLLMKVPIRDINSGMKLYRTELVQRYLVLCPNSMAFSDIIALIFISERHKVVELPITVEKRMAGTSVITTRTAFETVLEILHIIMLFNPMRVFLPVACICILAGLIWGTPLVLMGRGVSVGALLALTAGFFSFGLGLVAEQLSLIRKNAITQNSERASRSARNESIDSSESHAGGESEHPRSTAESAN